MSLLFSPKVRKLVDQKNWNKLASDHLDQFIAWLQSPLSNQFINESGIYLIQISDIELPGIRLVDFKCAIGIKFRNVRFKDNVHISSSELHRSIEFEHCFFFGSFEIENSQVNGEVLIFDCDFERALSICGSTLGQLNIQNVSTSENSWFSIDVVEVGTDLTFSNCDINFLADIHFLSVSGETFIDENVFTRGLSLLNCTFIREARITSSKFFDNLTLSSCRFDGYSSFEFSEFPKCVLDISDTSFPSEYPPILDNVKISYPISKFWLERLLGIAKTRGLHDAFRTLRKFAAQRHSHEEELLFFAMEMRAKRKHALSYLDARNWPNLLINHAYGIFSSFGLSIIRPVISLIVTLFVSAYCYSGLISQSYTERLELVTNLDSKALIAAFVGLFPFFGQVSIGRSITENSLCNPNNRTLEAHTDCLADLYWISTFEGILGFIFLFLLGLAMRNLAKIK